MLQLTTGAKPMTTLSALIIACISRTLVRENVKLARKDEREELRHAKRAKGQNKQPFYEDQGD